MRFIIWILVAACSAISAPTVERLKWDNDGAADSVTGIALKGAYSGAGLGVLRMNAASTAMELATPTGSGAPVNAEGATMYNLTATGNTSVSALSLSDYFVAGQLTMRPGQGLRWDNGADAGFTLEMDTGAFDQRLIMRGYAGATGLVLENALQLSRPGTNDVYFSLRNDAVDYGLQINGPTGQYRLVTGTGNTVYSASSSGAIDYSHPVTLQSTLSVTGNVSVNTDKFTVNASTGKAVSADTVAAVGLRAGRLNIGGSTLNFSDSVALVKIYRETQGAGSGTRTYGIDIKVKADAGDDLVNSTGLRINVPGGSLPDSAIGIRIDSVAGAANVRYAILSTSTAPSLLYGSLGVTGRIISEDTIRGDYVKGSYRSSVLTVTTNADFSVDPSYDMAVFAPEETITQNRRIVLLNPANYGLGYCVQIVRANDAQTTYTWSVDPQSWPINGSTDDIPIGTYGTLKVCTAVKASTGLVEEWVIVAQNPAP